MNRTRRELVAATLLGLAAAQLPPFLADAFGAPSPGEPSGREPGVDLTVAYDRAHRGGRPLLVLVIPTDEGLRGSHGQLLGALLNHGGDDALATLALFHVVCAFDTELQRLGAPLPEQPWLALLETTGPTPSAETARFFAGAPPAPGPQGRSSDFWEQQEEAFEARLDWMRRGLATLAPDPVTLQRWARQAEAVDPGRFVSARAGALAGRPGAAMTALSPIAVAEVAAADRRLRAQLGEALASFARSALLPERVAGSHWARGGGCGLEIEGAEVQNMVDCGMGHVPAKAGRMLYFWSPEHG